MDNKVVKFVVGVEQNALSNGVVVPVYVDFNKVPHLLLTANSGAGKTTLLTYILKQLSKMCVEVYLADFKGVDFMTLHDCSRYYKHERVKDALELVFDMLQERMENPKEIFKPIVLCIDEFSGFLSLYDKKTQEQQKQLLASIIMLGRGLKVYVICAVQRADASFISGRDNFGNCVGLGKLSEESIRMSFAEHKDSIVPKARGKGYLRTDGQPLKEIVVPRIRNYNEAMELIHSALL